MSLRVAEVLVAGFCGSFLFQPGAAPSLSSMAQRKKAGLSSMPPWRHNPLNGWSHSSRRNIHS